MLSQHLQSDCPLAQQIDLIVVSPMQRTLQTAQQSLGWLISRQVKVIALAEFQETTTNLIDVGRPVSELRKTWPGFDFSLMDPVFPAKEGLYEFSQEALLRRGAAARMWLRDRPEKVIAVVGHAGFMRIGLCNRKFANADWRIFDFSTDDEDDVENSTLVEWKTTEANGGGLGISEKGFFGWEVNDLKYMPENKGKSREELIVLCSSATLR